MIKYLHLLLLSLRSLIFLSYLSTWIKLQQQHYWIMYLWLVWMAFLKSQIYICKPLQCVHIELVYVLHAQSTSQWVWGKHHLFCLFSVVISLAKDYIPKLPWQPQITPGSWVDPRCICTYITYKYIRAYKQIAWHSLFLYATPLFCVRTHIYCTYICMRSTCGSYYKHPVILASR